MVQIVWGDQHHIIMLSYKVKIYYKGWPAIYFTPYPASQLNFNSNSTIVESIILQLAMILEKSWSYLIIMDMVYYMNTQILPYA